MDLGRSKTSVALEKVLDSRLFFFSLLIPIALSVLETPSNSSCFICMTWLENTISSAFKLDVQVLSDHAVPQTVFIKQFSS